MINRWMNRFVVLSVITLGVLSLTISSGCAGNGGYVEPGTGATDPEAPSTTKPDEKPGTETPG